MPLEQNRWQLRQTVTIADAIRTVKLTPQFSSPLIKISASFQKAPSHWRRAGFLRQIHRGAELANRSVPVGTIILGFLRTPTPYQLDFTKVPWMPGAGTLQIWGYTGALESQDVAAVLALGGSEEADFRAIQARLDQIEQRIREL